MLNKNKKILYGYFILSTLILAFFAHIQTTKAAEPVNLYRFWSDTMQGHFYTASEAEKNEVIIKYPASVWKYEGVAFQVYSNQESGTIPVHRFWSDQKRGHFYTASEDEKNYIITHYPTNVWKYEGIAWYAYSTQQPNTAPIYRFWSDNKQHHFFTFNQNEKNCVLNSYSTSTWNYEGIAYYVPGAAPVFDPNSQCSSALGPEVSVGLWYYSASSINSSPFEISANKSYKILDTKGEVVAQAYASTITTVKYDDNGILEVNNNTLPQPIYITPDGTTNANVNFVSADGDNSSIVFNTHRSDYIGSDWRGKIDNYRGKIRIRYYRGYDIFNGASPSSSDVTQIWVINILPLEHYVWGSAETSGKGNINHTSVMTTAFRSFGFRRVNLTDYKYRPLGFRLRSDSLDQNYGGYDWESGHPNIPLAARNTRATVVWYGNEAAITPYSSWSDGNTRSSSSYAWCKGKSDPYGNYYDSYWGNNTSISTTDLMNGGNHMIGLIGWGSVRLAADHGWNWQQILNYYYTGISLKTVY